ncbi:MAG TPA: OsmC family protein [Actinomycetota bacterium]|jgi:osmotically inducible protein OsmC|nr:OsmC family protein [Actinomycetota bacterium]
MPVREAEAEWTGTLQEGDGTMRFGGGAFEGRYSAASRFEEGPGTNPEELIGAAHAGCFSMALAGALVRAGFGPEAIRTGARVHIEKGDPGWAITKIDLRTEATVPDIEDARFHEIAEEAKRDCPVSKALAAVPIELVATLAS